MLFINLNLQIPLNQSLQNGGKSPLGGDFSKLGQKEGDDFKTFTRYSRVADKEQKKVLWGNCLFKLSKVGDLKKKIWETLL